MNIFGFSTEELCAALKIKADSSQTEDIPELLTRLHKEMANNNHTVSLNGIFHFELPYFRIILNFLTQLRDEPRQIRDGKNKQVEFFI